MNVLYSWTPRGRETRRDRCGLGKWEDFTEATTQRRLAPPHRPPVLPIELGASEQSSGLF